jgi:hypothetical protein
MKQCEIMYFQKKSQKPPFTSTLCTSDVNKKLFLMFCTKLTHFNTHEKVEREKALFYINFVHLYLHGSMQPNLAIRYNVEPTIKQSCGTLP